MEPRFKVWLPEFIPLYHAVLHVHMRICMCDELEMLAGQLEDQLQPTRMETEDPCALCLRQIGVCIQRE